MAISASLGVGSGIDINGLVKQLVKADGQPAFNALDRQESSTKSRLSALGKLKSALSDFQSAVQKLNNGSTFKTQQASSSNETLATATAGVGAVSGRYSLEVIQLAKAQKSISAAGLADLNAPVGEGSLNFTVGSSESFSVTIDSTNNTLAGLRDAINSAADNKGVTASIINVDAADGSTVSKLVLSAQKPGTANNFTVSGDGASLLQSAEQLTAGSDAIIKVDGQTATRSTNSISDVIPGVTLDLKSVPSVTTPPVATAFDVNVTLDTKSITEASNGFVEAYNKLQSVMKELGKYDPATKAAGALVGDSTLRSIQSQIRQASASPVTSAGSGANSLAMIGINIDRTGVMSLDSTKFNGVMNTNLSALSKVFSSTEGVAARLNKSLTQNLQAGGILDGQTTSLNDRMKTIGDNRDKVQLRLDNLEKSLSKQFTAMDTVVGKFKSTGTYLSQQFA
jgi:flagellar hook-associated protein 2